MKWEDTQNLWRTLLKVQFLVTPLQPEGQSTPPETAKIYPGEGPFSQAVEYFLYYKEIIPGYVLVQGLHD